MISVSLTHPSLPIAPVLASPCDLWSFKFGVRNTLTSSPSPIRWARVAKDFLFRRIAERTDFPLVA